MDTGVLGLRCGMKQAARAIEQGSARIERFGREVLWQYGRKLPASSCAVASAFHASSCQA